MRIEDTPAMMSNLNPGLTASPLSDASQHKFEQLLQSAQASSQNPHKAAAAPQADMKEAARQMETMLVTMMIKTMDKASGEGGLLGKSSQGLGYFKDMFFQEMATNMVENNGLGFSDALENIYKSK